VDFEIRLPIDANVEAINAAVRVRVDVGVNS
jgi:hypothetical protein